ncbi:hypothetical protein TTHERM_00575620 (macronuclear) [Tetrahymena thermophila SB210]|uniref:Uncharacterized protein n=1 Tax=Tetrahymena thermophila (strain SB210) TaxID=312017 RepID=Q22V38_TETTS|nr:hypothetical protein TTHERM_00575620 [Tetrahymena thermophila SB210]EAR89110.2 hypothetical protein TTHERM_00575620 [Tetrahymena thermophila SB210]|eukprot:XP_001009355.2 hypothetical protein TTHERM_00575620 [Tetrahymena thermophila SB210]
MQEYQNYSFLNDIPNQKIQLTEESCKIIEKLELKEKNYQKKILQLQKENIILTNNIKDLEDQKKRLRQQKLEYQKELELSKHKITILENEIDNIEIVHSCTSNSGFNKDSPEKSFKKLRRKILDYKDKFQIDTSKKEEIIQENIRLNTVIEEMQAKLEKANQVQDEIDKYENIFDQQTISFKKIQAILQGFFNDFEEIRVYQQLESDLISTNFLQFSQKINSLNSDTLIISNELIQETILTLLNQIEFGIKASLNLKKSYVEISDQLQLKDSENEQQYLQFENMQKQLQDALDARELYENENNYLKSQIEELAEQYLQEKNMILKKFTIEAQEEQFQLKSETEKLQKENQFLDEIMNKLVNLMPSQDTQELIQEIVSRARSILVIEKERIYIEQLLQINEQNMKLAIQSLPQDITDDDVCVIRKNVERFRESLKNCSQQKQMLVNELSDLLSKLDRAAIIQAHRLQAIRSTEQDEIINQAYLDLIEKEKQIQKNQNSSKTQKDTQEIVYRSARELLQQKVKREGNPLLSKNTQQRNQDLIQEELEIDQKLKSSLQNGSFTIKSILSNNRSYKEQALLVENDQSLIKNKKKDLSELLEDDQNKDKSLLQKHMLLKRNQFIVRGENPLNLDIDKSQDDYFSKLDYSKSNASEINLGQIDQQNQEKDDL